MQLEGTQTTYLQQSACPEKYKNCVEIVFVQKTSIMTTV
jgi:hypothetical protein